MPVQCKVQKTQPCEVAPQHCHEATIIVCGHRHPCLYRLAKLFLKSLFVKYPSLRGNERTHNVCERSELCLGHAKHGAEVQSTGG